MNGLRSRTRRPPRMQRRAAKKSTTWTPVNTSPTKNKKAISSSRVQNRNPSLSLSSNLNPSPKIQQKKSSPSRQHPPGAGFADCRSALVEAGANIEAAIDVLRKKGQAAAQKKAARQATEGLVGHYIHAGGKIGVLIEVNCESDFVARTEDFQRLCHDVAMHIAALDTRYVRREEVTQEILDREREIYM